MDILVFDDQRLPYALGALRGLFAEPSARRDRFLHVLARLHGTAVKLPTLPRPSAPRVAAEIREPHQRRRLVQLGVLMTTIDGVVMGKPTRALLELATALEVEEPVLEVLPMLVAKNPWTPRAYMGQRLLRMSLGAAWRDHGARGVWHAMAEFAGVAENKATAVRYARLARYPAGSVGRSLWEYLAKNGFAMPGLRGAIPERSLFHDVGHVLSGYGTDPAGEICQAAFQAGFVRDHGFTFLFLGVLQYHLGIPLWPSARAEVGFFDVVPVMTALARGARCEVDLSHRFDFWAFAEWPLERLRVELGVLPLTAAEPQVSLAS